jgi:hypothetical protein
MLVNRKLVLDTFCEVFDLIEPLANDTFWDFTKHTLVPGAVYLFGRTQFTEHAEQIKQLARDGVILPVLSNPAEGSDTMRWQLAGLDALDLVKEGKILVIAGGFLPDDIPFLYYENFMPKLLDYKENVAAQKEYSDRWTTDRPYKYLFLNGRGRKHRKFLLDNLDKSNVIWTNLDSAIGPIKLLDSKYEYDDYKNNVITSPDDGFVKNHLFNDCWGEIYLNPAPYLDTYFSLVTETVFDYPYTFRTEKIWKPICIGHPWIVTSNAGYYKDMRDIGYRTFGHLIDESFDTIDNNQDRLTRIAAVVADLCKQDLVSFITAAQDVCKYNQQHLAELGPQVRAEFPQRFIEYINERSRV